MPGSDLEFTTDNYQMKTKPVHEFRLVKARRGKQDEAELGALCGQLGVGLGAGHHGRRIPDVDELVKLESSVKAKLNAEEVMMLVLYTGPMVRLQNKIGSRKAV